MKLHEAIAHAEQGGRATCDALPGGAVIKTDAEGELRVVFERTGDGHVFTPKAEHYRDDWRKVEGWVNYG